jgi:ABC-2 type transport system permease protein
VIALVVGVLIRHSAGALALLLVYTLALEKLVPLIPHVGENTYKWMPFNVANRFLFGTGGSNGGSAEPGRAGVLRRIRTGHACHCDRCG